MRSALESVKLMHSRVGLMHKETSRPRCSRNCMRSRTSCSLVCIFVCVVVYFNSEPVPSPAFPNPAFSGSDSSADLVAFHAPQRIKGTQRLVSDGAHHQRIPEADNTVEEPDAIGLPHTDGIASAASTDLRSDTYNSRSSQGTVTNSGQSRTQSNWTGPLLDAGDRWKSYDQSKAANEKNDSYSNGPRRSNSAKFPEFSPEEKYLYYPRNGDFCKGASHTTWSLSCALGEALHLNRTFVLDMEYCVPKEHNDGKERVNDARLYFNILRIQRYVRIIPRHAFLSAWEKHNTEHSDAPISKKLVAWGAASQPLLNENATIIQRGEGDQKLVYAYEVCDVAENKVIKRPWGAIWGFAPQLMQIAWTIVGDLEWNFDSVHVRRGDKVAIPEKWPNLDQDTRPPRMLEVLKTRLKPGRRLYIATDEKSPGFFEPLSAVFNVTWLWDYRHLWAEGSEWWKTCEEILGPGSSQKPVFDGVMQGMVDYVVFKQAHARLETFNDLTKDPKHGVEHPVKAASRE